jgi:hypothetical protein
MAWVHLQKAQQAGWDSYEAVQRLIGDQAPDGLIVHAAGEVDGTWQSVSIWESQEAYVRFRDERLMPAVLQVVGAAALEAGPPPAEWFEVKHMLRS